MDRCLKKQVSFLFILFITANYCFSQIALLDQIFDFQKLGAYDKSGILIEKVDSSGFDSNSRARFLYYKGLNSAQTGSDLVKTYQLLLAAKALVNDDDLSLRFYINDELIYTYVSTIENVLSPSKLIFENCEIAQITLEPKMLINCDYYQLSGLDYETKTSRSQGLELLNHSKNLALDNNLEETLKTVEFNLGVVHDLSKNPDSALYYFDKIIPYYIKHHEVRALKDVYNNKGLALNQLKRYKEAILYFNKSIHDLQPYEDQEMLAIVSRNLAESYYLNKDFEESATLFRNKIRLSDSLKTEQSARSLEELETKYQVAQREKELLESEAIGQKQRAQIYALAGSAITLLLSGLFFYNNQRKKKLLAQKEQELEKQRANTILKNQELATIDAMISGQEKERKKLAEELHDNLGSSLTTIKLYFESLKSNVKDAQGLEVYHRTEKILDTTYETIRSMSHTRNNGVLASKGLIPSIEALAQKITASGQLKVEVIHHGLDKKLESSMELIIFRTVQELISNVVKHAHATTVIINLTSYEENLNIMVEDNGKGFDAAILPQNDGIGLNSIEKRIENLEGSFEVDSHLGRGTTINIDIPYYDQPNYS
jgi:signal transduction histidine kinase